MGWYNVSAPVKIFQELAPPQTRLDTCPSSMVKKDIVQMKVVYVVVC